MSDFKSYIKDKYNQEVQPKYSEEAWNKFAAYADIQPDKKDRKWLILLFTGILLIAVSSAIYLTTRDSQQDTVANISINYQESNDAIIEKETNVAIVADQHVGKNKGEEADLQSTNAIGINEDLINTTQKNNEGNLVKLIQTEELGATDTASDSPMKKIQSDTPTPTQNNDSGVVTFVAPPTLQSSETVPSDVQRTPVTIIKLPVEHFSLLNYETVVVNNPKIIPTHQVYTPGFIIAGIELGGGKSYHRSIDDHGVYMLSGIIGYGINERFSIRATVGFTQTRYSSRVLNRNLGLRSINYPVREARLDKVNSTTTYLETGIGVTYTTPAYKDFNISIGPGLVFVKEINRSLDYNFNQGDMDLQSINVDVEDHSTHPVNLSLDVGLNYRLTSDISFSLKGEYLKALKESSVELPRQARIKLGVEKKF